MSTMSKARAVIWERCGGLCEITGVALDYETFDAHHRRNKGMGGTSRLDRDSVENLLALDPIIHNGAAHSVHQDSPWSRPRGYLLSTSVTHPGMHPVFLRERYWVLLGADGQYHPLPGGHVPARC
jgi:hypothetical protein